MYHHTNQIPSVYEMDDYQVRTPTDIIGQHIHLPKWDLTSADGAANGWNYEDGVLSPGSVVERIHAIREYNSCTAGDERDGTPDCPVATQHPFFGQYNRADWLGARTTMQRWFADPVVNVHNIDRGLGNIFTHDHFGPSTHQQIGLYATVLADRRVPPGILGNRGSCTPDMMAADLLAAVIATGDISEDGSNDGFTVLPRFSDFQHAYETGVYVGAGRMESRIGGHPASADGFATPSTLPVVRMPAICWSRQWKWPLANPLDATHGPVRRRSRWMTPVSSSSTTARAAGPVFDPARVGPDGKPGMQADGLAGDLSYALQSRTDRAIAELNLAPSAITQVTGPTGAATQFPPHINQGDLPGDPFTPMLRTFSGDNVRLRVNAGGHEEEHNVTMHGVKWLHSGSGFGNSSNTGWKASQMVAISEQFGFMAPLAMMSGASGRADYLYSGASLEGYWSGLWG